LEKNRTNTQSTLGLGLSLFLVFILFNSSWFANQGNWHPFSRWWLPSPSKAMDDLNWGKLHFWVITVTLSLPQRSWCLSMVEEFHCPSDWIPVTSYLLHDPGVHGVQQDVVILCRMLDCCGRDNSISLFS
jgi:hypothetical protein